MIAVENDICAAVGCDKPATGKMVFEGLGFSANFCNKCLTYWESKKLELSKKNRPMLDNCVVEAASNIDHSRPSITSSYQVAGNQDDSQ